MILFSLLAGLGNFSDLFCRCGKGVSGFTYTSPFWIIVYILWVDYAMTLTLDRFEKYREIRSSDVGAKEGVGVAN